MYKYRYLICSMSVSAILISITGYLYHYYPGPELKPSDAVSLKSNIVTDDLSLSDSVDNASTYHVKEMLSKNIVPLDSEETEHAQEQYQHLNTNDRYPKLNQRSSLINARRPSLRMHDTELLTLLQTDSAWTSEQEPHPSLPLSQEEQYDGREFISFNSKKIETLLPGDILKIPVSQLNAEYEMQVDTVDVSSDGNITWKGHLTDFDTDNYASITQGNTENGSTLTMAGINTPQGNYTLEARGENGWIVNTNTLFKISPELEDDAVYVDPIASTESELD